MNVLGWVWLDEYVGGRVLSDTAPGIPFAPGSPAALDLLAAFVHPSSPLGPAGPGVPGSPAAPDLLVNFVRPFLLLV